VVWTSKHRDLHCVRFKMNDLFLTMSNCMKQSDVTEFRTYENETPTEISPVINGFLR
jgi:hypothetical protein